MRTYLHDKQQDGMVIHGARCAIGPQEAIPVSIQINGGRITRILRDPCLCLSPDQPAQRLILVAF